MAGPVDVPVDAAWAVGLLLALIRVATFAVTSPLLGRGVPATARIAFSVAVGMAMTTPVEGIDTVGGLVSAGMVNAAIGGVLGFVTGVILSMFTTAGGVVDWVSGLAVSAVFDPLQGTQAGVFARMFHLTATTLFVVSGGLGLLVTGLVGSARFLPLDAAITWRPELTGYVVDVVSLMLRLGVELALPVIGVLLMVELALGLASRFAPQANVFLLGLPLKLLTSLIVVGSSWALFPDAMRQMEAVVAESFDVVIRGLGA